MLPNTLCYFIITYLQMDLTAFMTEPTEAAANTYLYSSLHRVLSTVSNYFDWVVYLTADERVACSLNSGQQDWDWIQHQRLDISTNACPALGHWLSVGRHFQLKEGNVAARRKTLETSKSGLLKQSVRFWTLQHFLKLMFKLYDAFSAVGVFRDMESILIGFYW